MTIKHHIDNIVLMKMVWVYFMLAGGTGFVALLLSGIDRLDTVGMSVSVIWRLVLCSVFLTLAIIAFFKARKLGMKEDEIKDVKDADIKNLT